MLGNEIMDHRHYVCRRVGVCFYAWTMSMGLTHMEKYNPFFIFLFAFSLFFLLYP